MKNTSTHRHGRYQESLETIILKLILVTMFGRQPSVFDRSGLDHQQIRQSIWQSVKNNSQEAD